MNDWKSKLLLIKQILKSAPSQQISQTQANTDKVKPVKTDSLIDQTEDKASQPNTSRAKHSKTTSSPEIFRVSLLDKPKVKKSKKHLKPGSSQSVSQSQAKASEQNKHKKPATHSSAMPQKNIKLQRQTYLTQKQTVAPKAERPKLPPVPEKFTHHQGRILTRQPYFKTPEAWVHEGEKTQLSPSETGRVVDVVIGLDFGTSYTKAAVGLLDRIYPVSWYGISEMPNHYLLPSEYSVLPDASCHVGQAPEISFNQVRKQLKHPFIGLSVSSYAIADASIFIALALRYIRAWLYHNHAQKIGSNKIRWLVNIGAPSNGLEIDRLKSSYHQLGCLAWDLSVTDKIIQYDSAHARVRTNYKYGLTNELFDLQIVPEFVAQIASYVQSANRKSGLHALVDVGGGTLDIVTFIVHQDNDEDVFPFLIPEVKALGTHMLYQNRLVGVQDFNAEKLPDDLAHVIGCKEYARLVGLDVEHVASRDNLFWRSVKIAVGSVIHRTKQKRYRLSDTWTKGLPTFLTGGGGNIAEYSETVKTSAQNFIDGIKLMPLPKHPRLTDTFKDGNDSYQRLSVACGLAMDSFSLGRVIPAKDVVDDICPVTVSSKVVDRDELYPK